MGRSTGKGVPYAGTVEPAAAADLPAVMKLVAGYQAFYGVSGVDPGASESMLRRFLAPSADGILLVARTDGVVVGYAVVHWRLDTLAARVIGYLHDLFVAEEARTAGAGHALIHAAEAESRRHGAAAMTWMTAPDNANARRIYDKTPAQASEWIDYELKL